VTVAFDHRPVSRFKLVSPAEALILEWPVVVVTAHQVAMWRCSVVDDVGVD